MFPETAKKLKLLLRNVHYKTVLNAGSGAFDYFHDQQPWIWEDVLGQLLYNECSLVNVDNKPDVTLPFTHENKYTFMQADITKRIPCADQSIDVILCTSVVEHVEDPQAMLREFERVIRDDGILFLEAPSVYPIHHDPIDTGLRIADKDECAQFLGPTWEILHCIPIVGEPPFEGSGILVEARIA